MDDSENAISYTQKEFRYAREKKIPILAFIIEDDAKITGNAFESDPSKIQRLKAFKEEVMNGRTVTWWNDPKDLAAKVESSLYKAFDRDKRPGWIRTNKAAEDTIQQIADLSRKNLELEDENKKLRESIAIRKPEIYISIGSDKTADNYGEKDPTIISIKPIQKKGYLGTVPEKVSMEDFSAEDRKYLKQKDIDKYNCDLPDAEGIRQYDEAMFRYNTIHDNGKMMDFMICNTGTAKAVDVHVTLTFPKSFIIMKRNDVKDMTVPEPPHFPESLYGIIAKRRLGAVDRSLSNPLYKIGLKMNTLNSSLPSIHKSNDLLRPIDYSKSMIQSVNIDDQRVMIWTRDLLHKYCRKIDELCIAPTEVGDFVITASIMCEEYPEPETQKLKVRVVEPV